ncbi:MAG: hypothetical protein WA924_10260 [Burkholderiaceae bacterium]
MPHPVPPRAPGPADAAGALTYNFAFTRRRLIMEAERLNSLEALLEDLAERATDLRRYL